MEFRRHLSSNGVSPAGVLEALTGQRVTHAGDQSIISRLGYYVAPSGEVSLAKSLGPASALPKDWLALERKKAIRTDNPARATAQRAALNTVQLDRAGQFQIASLSASHLKGSTTVATPSKSMSSSEAAMSALIGQAGKLSGKNSNADAARKAAEEARKAKIKELEKQIAALQEQIEQLGRRLDAELVKEFAIMHLANPITFPFFVVVYENWKQTVRKLQKKLMELVTKLLPLLSELIKLKNS